MVSMIGLHDKTMVSVNYIIVFTSYVSHVIKEKNNLYENSIILFFSDVSRVIKIRTMIFKIIPSSCFSQM